MTNCGEADKRLGRDVRAFPCAVDILFSLTQGDSNMNELIHNSKMNYSFKYDIII